MKNLNGLTEEEIKIRISEGKVNYNTGVQVGDDFQVFIFTPPRRPSG